MLGILVLASFSLLAARVEVVLGPAQRAMKEPFGVDFDREGNWYVVEHKGEVILRIDGKGVVSTFAGTGEVGNSGDGGPAAQALMFDPHGIAITRDGAWMYVADTRNHTVRRIDRRKGIITTVAGTGQEGFSGDGGPATQATFKGTFGIALAPDDRALYIADLGNKRVRKLDLRSGIVTTVAGNGQAGVPTEGAVAKDSPLIDPRAVAVDSRHRVYVLERNGNALRVVEGDGSIHTLIAPGKVTPDLKGPKHLCVDPQDRVVIADAENHLIRRYDPKSGATTTIAGTGAKGDTIDANDPLRTELNRPHGVFVTGSGDLYIADSYNHRILRMRQQNARAAVSLEIRERSDVGAGVPYERLVGTAHFRIDPSHRLNRGITDIAHGPKGTDGLVEYHADFYILRPKLAGNQTLLFEVSNRGGKGMLGMFQSAPASMDPRQARDFGDERLMRQGYTLAWLGWQHDVSKGGYALRLHAPKAAGVSGEVRAQLVADTPTSRIPFAEPGHTAYVVADGQSVVVTERNSPQDTPRRLAPESYSVTNDAVILSTDATPGRIYEVSYLSRDPEIAMLGLSAIRDFIGHLRDTHAIRLTIGFGVSQSAMLLRAFLQHGFNEGLDGKRVFDGVLAHTAGGRRIVYRRFAQPSRTAAPLRAVGYGTEGHTLEQTAAPYAPKIIYSNSSYEYWGATASLLHTTPDGTRDLPIPENVRIYMLAGGQHGPSGFPPSRGRAQHLQNPNDYRPVVRALLDRLREWIADGQQPPPSRYPRLDDGTLVVPTHLSRTPGLSFPQQAWQPFNGKARALVPQVDADGNDMAGVRTPDIAAPLATYTGWNLRTPQIGRGGELIGNSGSFFPFPLAQVMRRYSTRERYLTVWDEQAQTLVRQGLLLPDDVPAMRQSAQSKWDWLQKQYSHR